MEYKSIFFSIGKLIISVFRTCQNSRVETNCPEEAISNCSMDNSSHTSNIPIIQSVSSTEHLLIDMDDSKLAF